MQTDLKLSSNKEKKYFSYSGSVKTANFDLGKLLNNQQLGKITFNLGVQGEQYSKQYPSISLKGLVSSVDYSGYTYQNISLDGEYKQGGFSGKAALEDQNGSIELNGAFNAVSRVPSFNFQAAMSFSVLH